MPRVLLLFSLIKKNVCHGKYKHDLMLKTVEKRGLWGLSMLALKKTVRLADEADDSICYL